MPDLVEVGAAAGAVTLGAPVVTLAAWGSAAFWLLCLLHTLMGALFIPRMPTLRARDEHAGAALVSRSASASSDHPVKVSIIFAYRNENAAVLNACRSMLDQDHGSIEVIAVNDRSTDGSERALDPLSSDPRLKRVTIDQLPNNWLGKSHALQTGADLAAGEWLIFTDADVIFRSDTVRRAIAMARMHGTDHLALLPQVVLDGPIERLFYRTFGSLFAVRFWPWASRFSKIYGFAGVGAFNMIRRLTYRQIGEHRAISMDIADDIMLAKRVKEAGLRLFLASGEDAVSVRWFVGLDGMMRSLHKNAFRGFNYQIGLAILGSLSLIICALAPYVYLWASGGASEAWLAWAVGSGAAFLLQFGFGKKLFQNLLISLLMPMGLVLLAVVVFRSAWDSWLQHSVVWRGTRYPLELLRKNQPL